MRHLFLVICLCAISGCAAYGSFAPRDLSHCRLLVSPIEFTFANDYQYQYTKTIDKNVTLLIPVAENIDGKNTTIFSGLFVQVQKGSTFQFVDDVVKVVVNEHKKTETTLSNFKYSGISVGREGLYSAISPIHKLTGTKKIVEASNPSYVWYETSFKVKSNRTVNQLNFNFPDFFVNGSVYSLGTVEFQRVVDHRNAKNNCLQ